jgi:hypothetical protein
MIALIEMSNQIQMLQCQSIPVWALDFDIHLNFELWHLTFSRYTVNPRSIIKIYSTFMRALRFPSASLRS